MYPNEACGGTTTYQVRRDAAWFDDWPDITKEDSDAMKLKWNR